MVMDTHRSHNKEEFFQAPRVAEYALFSLVGAHAYATPYLGTNAFEATSLVHISTLKTFYGTTKKIVGTCGHQDRGC